MKKYVYATLLSLLLLMPGCATVITTVVLTQDEVNPISMSGTILDVIVLMDDDKVSQELGLLGKVVCFLDLPLSFSLDILLLPITLPFTLTNDNEDLYD